MAFKRWLASILGTVGVLLGGMWLLQGVGVLHLRPILCFAACEPIQQPSTTWTAIGLGVGVLGVAALACSYRAESPK